jgi:hypothetical protein
MEAAMAGREPADFPAPPDELLQEGAPASLSLAPPEVDPGGTVTVTGTGFRFCTAAWSVHLEGTPVSSAADTGSASEDRSATLTIPTDLAAGAYRVVARCDSGAGARGAAQATLVVRGPATTTTSTAETTTTTTDGGQSGRSTTTSSTTSSSTTTTTAGGGAATDGEPGSG